MKTKTIDGRVWTLRAELEKYNHWTASYFCADGDGVELYIAKDNSEMELSCFSGIGSSKIIISDTEINCFTCNPNKIDMLEFASNNEDRYLRIADYLCRKFCEYVDVSNHKTIK